MISNPPQFFAWHWRRNNAFSPLLGPKPSARQIGDQMQLFSAMANSEDLMKKKIMVLVNLKYIEIYRIQRFRICLDITDILHVGNSLNK